MYDAATGRARYRQRLKYQLNLVSRSSVGSAQLAERQDFAPKVDPRVACSIKPCVNLLILLPTLFGSTTIAMTRIEFTCVRQGFNLRCLCNLFKSYGPSLGTTLITIFVLYFPNSKLNYIEQL